MILAGMILMSKSPGPGTCFKEVPFLKIETKRFVQTSLLLFLLGVLGCAPSELVCFLGAGPGHFEADPKPG